MNDEQTDRMKEVIHLYSTWLGLWGVRDDPAYDREYFEAAHYGRFGYRELLLDVETALNYRIMVFELGYGDDGGTSELTVYFDREEDPQVRHVVRVFDTMVQSIYDAT